MNTSRCHDGFSLIEVTLALGVMAFCLLALFGLLPVGLTSNQTAVEQTTAGNIATSIATDLQSAPLGSGTSSRFGFDMNASSSAVQTLFFADDLSANGTGKVAGSTATSSPAPHYRAAVGLYPPPSDQKKATTVRIVVTWPALADKTSSAWPANFSGSFETVTALNRSN